jgi:hypothetical protein
MATLMVNSPIEVHPVPNMNKALGGRLIWAVRKISIQSLSTTVLIAVQID